jgi:hypothetical protein
MTARRGASCAPKILLQADGYSGKKKDHMVKHVLLVGALLMILFLSDTYGGRTHDKRIADATPYPLPPGSRLLKALGFLGFSLPEVEILMPTRKLHGQALTVEQHWSNEALHQRAADRACQQSCEVLPHRQRPAAFVEAGHPRPGDGNLLCPAQLPGASDPMATYGLNRDKLKSLNLVHLHPHALPSSVSLAAVRTVGIIHPHPRPAGPLRHPSQRWLAGGRALAS